VCEGGLLGQAEPHAALLHTLTRLSQEPGLLNFISASGGCVYLLPLIANGFGGFAILPIMLSYLA